jgi:hypothetical protein
VRDAKSQQPIVSAHVISTSEMEMQSLRQEEVIGVVGPGSGITDDKGHCRPTDLSDGTHTLEIYADGYVARKIKDADPGQVILVDLAKPTVTGTVEVVIFDVTHTPLPGMELKLSVDGQSVERTVLSDHEGRAVFQDVPSGEHQVILSGTDWLQYYRGRSQKNGNGVPHCSMIRRFELASGETKTLGMGFAPGSSEIIATTITPDGTPVEGATLSIFGPYGLETQSDERGRVHFENLLAGTYRVSLNDWFLGQIEVPKNEILRPRWLIGETTVRARVVKDVNGEAVTDIHVSLGQDSNGGTRYQSQRLDSAGQAEFTGVVPGSWQLTC